MPALAPGQPGHAAPRIAHPVMRASDAEAAEAAGSTPARPLAALEVNMSCVRPLPSPAARLRCSSVLAKQQSRQLGSGAAVANALAAAAASTGSGSSAPFARHARGRATSALVLGSACLPQLQHLTVIHSICNPASNKRRRATRRGGSALADRQKADVGGPGGPRRHKERGGGGLKPSVLGSVVCVQKLTQMAGGCARRAARRRGGGQRAPLGRRSGGQAGWGGRGRPEGAETDG